MNEEWEFYLSRVDDAPASIFVNLGLGRQAPIPAYCHMGYVRVEMRRPRPDGLSSQEEFDDLAALERDIEARLPQEGDCLYVGRNTSAGNRDFYFYAADPVRFEAAARRAMSRHPEYRVEIGSQPDERWSVYQDFLHPSDDDFQRIANRRVCDALADKGDRLSERRPIDHFIDLPNKSAADSLAAEAKKDGFALLGIAETDGGRWSANIVRDDAPAGMDEVAVKLAALSRALGGRYDGWGCGVVD